VPKVKKKFIQFSDAEEEDIIIDDVFCDWGSNIHCSIPL
jgi:hypothetical protein